MLEDHWATLEGDWSIYHHRDLVADAYGPAAIGVRKLRAYIEALPAASATARVMRWAWTERDEQGASTVEMLGDIARSSRQLVALQIQGGKYDPKDPAVTWPRPWVEVTPELEKASSLSRQGVRAVLGGI